MMKIPTNKAAENAVQKSIPTASRAVRATEVKNIKPNIISQTKTSMPWQGWVSSFLSDKLGSDRYESLRRLLLFKYDDNSYLEQVSPPSRKVIISKDEKVMAQYRTPAPGSRKESVQQPAYSTNLSDGDPYNISYYIRDTTRRYENESNLGLEKLKLDMMNEENIDVQEKIKKLEENPNSSRGNKGVFATGKSDFDPTGLRSSMSATHESLKQSLDTYMPNHLPYPTWWNEQDEIVAWYKERDLPVPIGKTGYGTVPTHGRISRW